MDKKNILIKDLKIIYYDTLIIMLESFMVKIEGIRPLKKVLKAHGMKISDLVIMDSDNSDMNPFYGKYTRPILAVFYGMLHNRKIMDVIRNVDLKDRKLVDDLIPKMLEFFRYGYINMEDRDENKKDEVIKEYSLVQPAPLYRLFLMHNMFQNVTVLSS